MKRIVTKFIRRVPTGWFAVALMLAIAPRPALAQANMRREGALTVAQTLDDTRGFYSATIDASNGYAYFSAKYVYKIDISKPLPVQVGAGISTGRQAYTGTMDVSAGCAYFAVGTSIYQILANGTNAPTLGGVMPLGLSGAFLTQVLVDPSDPANHYLYAMVETGNTSSVLYKIALNSFPNPSAIVGTTATTAGQPALGYGVIDLTNRCAYYGSFVPSTLPPYVAKFALGDGTNPPIDLGGVALDTSTNRSVGAIVLDIDNGYGYCDSDGNDLLFGHGRVYKWALNGTNPPTLVASVDMHTNEGYCHVAAIKPKNGLLYFSSDLSYPAFVYRFRLPPGTNAPVETGDIPLLNTTNTVVPAWGYNPTNASNWGEVFARSIAYDPVRDFVYIGRDCADQQTQPYTDQIVKVALDRDETVLAFTEDTANTNNVMPYREPFESYAEGFDLAGTNGWFAEDPLMAVVSTNADTYAGIFPIAGSHGLTLQVDGAVTNRFRPRADANVLIDAVLQCKYWTDPLMLTLSNTPFAICITTNGHLAVWNATNPPAGGNGWTELTDTSIASDEFFRLTVDANYDRDASGEFYYRIWINEIPSTSPQTRYASADTNQNYFGDIVAQGRFALDDLVVSEPGIAVTNIARNPDGTVNLSCVGVPGLACRVWATTNLGITGSWQVISTNTAGADGTWHVTDAGASAFSSGFYRASLP